MEDFDVKDHLRPNGYENTKELFSSYEIMIIQLFVSLQKNPFYFYILTAEIVK